MPTCTTEAIDFKKRSMQTVRQADDAQNARHGATNEYSAHVDGGDDGHQTIAHVFLQVSSYVFLSFRWILSILNE